MECSLAYENIGIWLSLVAAIWAGTFSLPLQAVGSVFETSVETGAK